jgi:CMP-N,N'-diacetyllegionaminic acid synthase
MSNQIIAVIPARAGSKGIPDKNIRLLAGKPLIAHSIEHARQSPSISRVIVSTDGEKIAAVAKDHGADVVWRPAEISGDEATSEESLIHVLRYLDQSVQYHPDLVVFLQCTSPIRQPNDIEDAIQTLIHEDADSLLSVVPSHKFLWQRDHLGSGFSINYDYRTRPRRQDRSPEYAENGSIYIFKPWVLQEENNRLGGKIALYEMNQLSAVDIDEPHDFALCEWMMRLQSDH